VGWKTPERELGQAGIKEERRRACWTQKRWTRRGFFLLLSFSSSLCLAELFWGKGEVAKERGWKDLQSRFKTKFKVCKYFVFLSFN
jgi:hypothetical protein